MATAKRKIIFVGGAPRSGTTAVHGLLCTAKNANNYAAETSFLTGIVSAYALGLNNWDVHTREHFASKDEYRKLMGRMLNTAITHLHRFHKAGEWLVVKDPLLTSNFPLAAELLPDQARFVTVVRNPLDILRSRQEVSRKGGHEMEIPHVRRISKQAMRDYAHLSDERMAGCLFSFRYEDLQDGKTITDLTAFTGLKGIDPDALWSGRKEDSSLLDDTNWQSPKYGKPLDTTPRLNPLQPDFARVVRRICAPLMSEHGYE